jgi:hypothetical protein
MRIKTALVGILILAGLAPAAGAGAQLNAAPPSSNACANGIDDDADRLADEADPGCTGPGDGDESNVLSSCLTRTFEAGSWPPACWRPYGAAAPRAWSSSTAPPRG